MFEYLTYLNLIQLQILFTIRKLFYDALKLSFVDRNLVTFHHAYKHIYTHWLANLPSQTLSYPSYNMHIHENTRRKFLLAYQTFSLFTHMSLCSKYIPPRLLSEFPLNILRCLHTFSNTTKNVITPILLSYPVTQAYLERHSVQLHTFTLGKLQFLHVREYQCVREGGIVLPTIL